MRVDPVNFKGAKAQHTGQWLVLNGDGTWWEVIAPSADVAERLSMCWNVLADEDVKYMAGLLREGRTYKQRLQEEAESAGRYMSELSVMERERDALRQQLAEVKERFQHLLDGL